MSAKQEEVPRRILVGYEGDGGGDAVALCHLLAGAGAERALLVHVVHHAGLPSRAYKRLDGEEGAPGDDFFAAAVERLDGLEVETRSYAGGSPARVLHDLAEQGECDLIVVGSPHRDGVLRGSVARSLLHGAPVPIAIAPLGYGGSEHGPLQRIAVGYDATEEAEEALRLAAALAREAGAGIEVLNVERPKNPPIAAFEYTLDFPEDPKEILERARHELGDLEAAAKVLTGTTAEALSEACASGVDLLCVGSRGYGAATRVLLGSVADELIVAAPVPLLIAARPGGEG